jgi:hypothetical protein
LTIYPNVDATKQTLASDPRTVYVFVSPSGTGLKLGVHVPIIENDAAYKHAWHVVREAFEEWYQAAWDPSGKDVSRLCFVSHDPDLYFNPKAPCFDVSPALQLSDNLSITQPNHSLPDPRHHDSRDYVERAIRTAIDMIASAELGTRHYTRLKAARLLGGYVGGGLLTEERAYSILAQALVGHTEHLERALQTVENGLKYGQAHPITLDDLVTDRDEWVRQHRHTHSRPEWTPPDDSCEGTNTGSSPDGNPWEGTNTLLLKPYVGYRGLRSRVRGKGATRGHSR